MLVYWPLYSHYWLVLGIHAIRGIDWVYIDAFTCYWRAKICECYMTHEIGESVCVYDNHGNLRARGNIVGINRSTPPYFDVQPSRELSGASRINSIPASLVRKVYGPKKFAGAKHIDDRL